MKSQLTVASCRLAANCLQVASCQQFTSCQLPAICQVKLSVLYYIWRNRGPWALLVLCSICAVFWWYFSWTGWMGLRRLRTTSRSEIVTLFLNMLETFCVSNPMFFGHGQSFGTFFIMLMVLNRMNGLWIYAQYWTRKLLQTRGVFTFWKKMGKTIAIIEMYCPPK